MNLTNTRLSRRTLTAAGLGASVALVGGSRGTFAQNATPEASPAMLEMGVFDSTGLTELVFTAEQYTYTTGVPGAMGEGWYIITLKNTTDSVASANLVLLPEGTSGGDLSGAASADFQGEGGELPDWWNNATFVGGNVAAAGESTSTLAYLTPGTWFIFSSNPASTQTPSSFLIQTPDELEANYGIAASATPAASPVAAGMAAPEGVVATVTVKVDDSSLIPDGAMAGGRHILQVTNDGEQVHDVIVLRTDETVDEDSAASLAASWVKGEDTGSTVAGGVGMLSPAMTAFAGIDVQPGTYMMFSSVPDADGGLQIDKGLVAIFTAQ